MIAYLVRLQLMPELRIAAQLARQRVRASHQLRHNWLIYNDYV
jgi:hypothetical protein